MPILNFGSCCIDNVYSVPHFAAPGETLPCLNYEIHPGGKGLNQSIALAACGAEVHHFGKVGKDGHWLIELLKSKNVTTNLMQIDEGPSGHANIQVNPEGENSIVLFGKNGLLYIFPEACKWKTRGTAGEILNITAAQAEEAADAYLT